MSKRDDIIDGTLAEKARYGLVYTKKCGWIDVGHANPKGGADKLWTDLKAAQLPPGAAGGAGWAAISYQQSMAKFGIRDGITRRYEVKRNLSTAEMESVALAIFLEVSIEFETKQGNWFYGHVTDSGFSVEDLVSNVVGFYRAVRPGRNYVDSCEPVSKADALKIWDTFGAVGSYKNMSPMPMLFQLTPDGKNGGAMCAPMPSFLDDIKPAPKGTLFRDAP